MNIKSFLSKSIVLFGLFFAPTFIYSQYQWTVYAGDPNFMALEDQIDKGRILYHKSAQNNSSIAGNRGLMFDATLFAFPSLAGSFAWSQVRVNVGRISFYPHIFTFDKGTSALSIAILFNISRVEPIRGIRTRPSFSPTSLLQLEKEKMNFTKLKFVSEGFETELVLQTAFQETELSLSDYDVNYNYWVKSTPTQKEAMGLRTFFARPLNSFKLRAYNDKGYLDTTLAGKKVTSLGDIFVKTVDLYQRLINPNYINRTNTIVTAPAPVINTNTQPKASTNARVKGSTNAQPKRKVRKRRPPTTTRKKVRTRVVQTNKRPKTTRVVKPK